MSALAFAIVMIDHPNESFLELQRRAMQYEYFAHSQQQSADLFLFVFERLTAAIVFGSIIYATSNPVCPTKIAISRDEFDYKAELPNPFKLHGIGINRLETVLKAVEFPGLYVGIGTDYSEITPLLIESLESTAVEGWLRCEINKEFFSRDDIHDAPETQLRITKLKLGTEFEDPKRFISILRKCIESGIKTYDVYCNLGALYLKLAKKTCNAKPRYVTSAVKALETSMTQFKKQLSEQQDEGIILSNLSAAYYMKDKFVEALKLAREAIESCPNNYHFRSNYAAFLMAWPDPIEARKQLLMSLKECPFDFAARFNFGMLLIRCGDAKGAATHLEHCAIVRPFDSSSNQWAALCFAKLQAYRLCLKYSEKAFRLSPSDPVTGALYALALAKTEAVSTALSVMDGLLKKHPTDIALYITKASFLIWNNDFLGAKNCYLQAREHGIEDDALDNSLASVCLANNEPKEAMLYLSSARLRWPKNEAIKSNEASLNELISKPAEELNRAVIELGKHLKRLPGIPILNVEYSTPAVTTYEMRLKTRQSPIFVN